MSYDTTSGNWGGEGRGVFPASVSQLPHQFPAPSSPGNSYSPHDLRAIAFSPLSPAHSALFQADSALSPAPSTPPSILRSRRAHSSWRENLRGHRLYKLPSFVIASSDAFGSLLAARCPATCPANSRGRTFLGAASFPQNGEGAVFLLCSSVSTHVRTSPTNLREPRLERQHSFMIPSGDAVDLIQPATCPAILRDAVHSTLPAAVPANPRGHRLCRHPSSMIPSGDAIHSTFPATCPARLRAHRLYRPPSSMIPSGDAVDLSQPATCPAILRDAVDSILRATSPAIPRSRGLCRHHSFMIPRGDAFRSARHTKLRWHRLHRRHSFVIASSDAFDLMPRATCPAILRDAFCSLVPRAAAFPVNLRDAVHWTLPPALPDGTDWSFSNRSNRKQIAYRSQPDRNQIATRSQLDRN